MTWQVLLFLEHMRRRCFISRQPLLFVSADPVAQKKLQGKEKQCSLGQVSVYSLCLVFLFCLVSLFNPFMSAVAKPAKMAPKLNQNNAGIFLLEANRLAAHRQYAAAINKYKEAVKQDPKNPAVYHMYGRTLALMGLVADACEQYEIALRYAPKNAEIWTDLGVALVVNGQAGKGALRLKKATELNSKFVSAHNNLGAALAQLGDYRAAAEQFEISLRLQPRNPAIQKKLERVQLQMAETVPFDFNAPEAEKQVAKTAAESRRDNGAGAALPGDQGKQAQQAAEGHLEKILRDGKSDFKANIQKNLPPSSVMKAPVRSNPVKNNKDAAVRNVISPSAIREPVESFSDTLKNKKEDDLLKDSLPAAETEKIQDNNVHQLGQGADSRETEPASPAAASSSSPSPSSSPASPTSLSSPAYLINVQSDTESSAGVKENEGGSGSL